MNEERLTYIVASNKLWHKPLVSNIADRIGCQISFVENPSELTLELLDKVKPRYIFFPHWSWIIPDNVWNNYECVIFHMTDLPFGRGGSPLQNLIIRKIYETKITALRCVKELDAGPIYKKKKFSLYGSAEEIFLRASAIIQEMILEIIMTNPIPTPQEGRSIVFPRRKPEESEIISEENLTDLFDKIRMLDAPEYPLAFLEKGNFRFEFSRASLKNVGIVADVLITKVR